MSPLGASADSAMTMPDGGVNPSTRERFLTKCSGHPCSRSWRPLGAMGRRIPGYSTLGSWSGMSGVGGGSLAIVSGNLGVSAFDPLPDAAGSSLSGQFAARFLSQWL
jgi:glutaminase